METVVLKSQGTDQRSISRPISKTAHEHTGPDPIVDTFRARDLGIDGPYTLCVTDDLGGASVDDGTLAIDNNLPIDSNMVE